MEGIISNSIADKFEIHNRKIIDDSIVQNCIEYYRLIVNNENDLNKKIEDNSFDGFYNDHSYNIVKAVCKLLSIDMNIAILKKLIQDAIHINNGSNNSIQSNIFIEATINLAIEIIAGIDWTRDKTKSKVRERDNNYASEQSIDFYLVPSKAKIPTIKKIGGVEKLVDIEEYLGFEAMESTIIDWLGDKNARKIGVTASNNSVVKIYGLGLAGISSTRFHLCDIGMAEQRVIVSSNERS